MLSFRTIAVLLLSVITVGSISARADQCLGLSKDQAASAKNLMELNPKILRFCQLCGDPVPKEIAVGKVTFAAAHTSVPEMDTMVLNEGRALDLAYHYVKIGSNVWVNLGLLSACTPYICNPDSPTPSCRPTSVNGVSQYLTEKNGVLTPSPIF